MSRSRHHGPGYSCRCCKPWKHGLEERYRPSERRQLDNIRAELDEMEQPYDWQQDECQGCKWCICVKCGGPIVATPDRFGCLYCAHDPDVE